MNLNFLRSLNYLYFTSYWTGLVASTVGATDEGAGCSLPSGMTFGSVRARAMFTSDPCSVTSVD